ncbi:hypothetical protein BCR35DRAFT_279742 [Leucosporidium creatinivorum]|uniref:Uncharacterized protein n=1 Tax=Leucosporidium creatinivorum TaxID=106004 RepID=A0A1Y2F4N7_9BASI|nr:hypothetical protein BCR35DRAFT_279742 [Leucosporidium creatinivorum]
MAEGAPTPTAMSSQLSLDLRLRFLETLLSPSTSNSSPSSTVSLSRRVSLINSLLTQSLESGAGTEAVRRFVANYDLNEPLLSLPPVSTAAPTSDELPPASKVALILEAENEIRSLERDLREVEALGQRGIVGAGKLAEHEPLKSELTQVKADIAPVSTAYTSLEARTNALLSRYNDYISTLSEIFISWNDIVSAAEEAVTRLEKERNQELDIS